MEESRVTEPVGYHLSFEDGRDDPDGRQLPTMVREPLAATATKGAAYYLSCMEMGRYGGWSNETIPHPKQIGGGVHSSLSYFE